MEDVVSKLVNLLHVFSLLDVAQCIRVSIAIGLVVTVFLALFVKLPNVRYFFLAWVIAVLPVFLLMKFPDTVLSKLVIGLLIALAVAFLINISNSPDLRLLTDGKDIVPKKDNEYELQMAWENLGGYVDAFRVQIYVPKKYESNIKFDGAKKLGEIEFDEKNEIVKGKFYFKKGLNPKDNHVIYQKDEKELKMFANSPSFKADIVFSFTDTKELYFKYVIFAESMAPRAEFSG